MQLQLKRKRAALNKKKKRAEQQREKRTLIKVRSCHANTLKLQVHNDYYFFFYAKQDSELRSKTEEEARGGATLATNPPQLRPTLTYALLRLQCWLKAQARANGSDGSGSLVQGGPDVLVPPRRSKIRCSQVAFLHAFELS